MISINNEPMIDMMKTIDHKFFQDHSDKIKIEPSIYSITVKYIRELGSPIRDIIMVFDGDGIMKLTGLLIDGTYISNRQFDITAFVRDSNLFRTLLNKNFFNT